MLNRLPPSTVSECRHYLGLIKWRVLTIITHIKISIDNNRHRCCTALIFGTPATPGSVERETNHYIARCASVLARSYLAGRSPEQLVIDLFAQHQRFAVCCPLPLSSITDKKDIQSKLNHYAH